MQRNWERWSYLSRLTSLPLTEKWIVNKLQQVCKQQLSIVKQGKITAWLFGSRLNALTEVKAILV